MLDAGDDLEQSPAQSAVRETGRPRAVLLEERAAVIDELTAILEAFGCAVEVARSLDSVPDAVRRGPPDIVLARVEFDGGAGIHLGAVLRCRSRRVRIVAYTRCLHSHVVEVTKDLSMADHVVAEEHLGRWLDTVMPHMTDAARADRLAVQASQELRAACRPFVEDVCDGVKLGIAIADFETHLIRATLALQPRQRAAARLLGLSESTLRARLKKLGIKSATGA